MSTDLSPGEPGASGWPGRVIALCQEWKTATTPREKSRVLSDLWLLLNSVLTYYIRTHGMILGFADPEDARDIASEKAMVFLHGLESDPGGAASQDAPRVCAYLSTLARNGLVDALRKQGRRRNLGRKMEGFLQPGRSTASNDAEVNIRHDRFVEAISACINEMTPRARSVWFLRAFLDMPSKKIASHPDVRMTATSVDMMLLRARRALHACMKAKGFDANDAPTGTFVALWDALRERDSGEMRRDGDDP